MVCAGDKRLELTEKKNHEIHCQGSGITHREVPSSKKIKMQASKYMKSLLLMKSKENVTDVKRELSNIIKGCEAKGEHESSLSLPIAQVEVEKQNKWFHTQITF